MGKLVTLREQQDRDRVAAWAQKARVGSRLELMGPKRSISQNDRMWAMLGDVSKQATLGGKTLTDDEWKVVFLHGLAKEVAWLPSLDGASFVPYGRHSSKLSKEEISDMMELITAWGTRHGVVFSDPKYAKEAA